MIIHKKEDIHQNSTLLKENMHVFNQTIKRKSKKRVSKRNEEKKSVYKRDKKVVCRRKEINNVVY